MSIRRNGANKRTRRRLAGYLERNFRATEEENRRSILEAMPARPGGCLLDLGCGDGALTMRAAERIGAVEVRGVERVDAFADRAASAGVQVLRVDLQGPLPLPDSSIDVIHSNQVIEHLPGTDAFVREIRRLLRPDGYALVSTNNLASWHNIVSLALGWQPPPAHVSDEVIVGNPVNLMEGARGSPGQNHLRLFTGRALAGLAGFHGLSVVLDRSVGFYPLPVRAARQVLRVAPRHGAFLVQRWIPASESR